MKSRLPLFCSAGLALAASASAAGGVDGGQITTMTFHSRVVIRVPRLGPPPAPAAPATAWKEKKGPACIVAADLAGAMVPDADMVDLVLAGNKRVRARLEEGCEPLDFYSGFYLRPAADGKVCAGRDVIRTRSGGACAIARFTTLKASRKR